MPAGGIDGSAAVKAFVVCIVSLCFLAQYCALLRACVNGDSPYGQADGSEVELGDCRVPVIALAMTTYNDSSTWAMAYAVVYSVISGLSFLGCAMITCKADGCAKMYALGLVICMGILTLFDYWVLIAAHNTGNDKGIPSDSINYQTFQIATRWFMELAIYLNAAADAWITNDEEQVDKDVFARN